MIQNLKEQGFDYAALNREARIVVLQRTCEIKNLLRRTAQDIIEIGQKLVDVKQQLGHGNFRNWLKAEFDLSLSAATKFMQVYEQFKNVNFTQLNVAISALYLLAAPSTSSNARQEALARANEGESITYSKAKSIINRYQENNSSVSEQMSTLNRSHHYQLPPQTIDVLSQTVENNDCLITERTRFRISIQDVGSIVKLYRADELSYRALQVGAEVKIIAGRFQERTATIQEILVEPTPTCTHHQRAINQKSLAPDMEHSLELTYAGVRLRFEGHPQDLNDFFEQTQTNAIAQKIFRQAKLLAEEISRE